MDSNVERVVLEFPDKANRDKFLGLLCDGGIENAIYEAMSMHNIEVNFNYRKAFKAWGWDGKGDPTVGVEVRVR